jgi:hypothetical protein
MNITANTVEAAPHLYDYQKLWKIKNPNSIDRLAVICEVHSNPGSWYVEKLDGDGQTCHVAAFSGPLALQRVMRYADQEYGRYDVRRPMSACS